MNKDVCVDCKCEMTQIVLHLAFMAIIFSKFEMCQHKKTNPRLLLKVIVVYVRRLYLYSLLVQESKDIIQD